MDDLDAIRTAKEEGKAEGKEEGKEEERMAIAKVLLEKGVSLELIEEATGLTSAQLQELKNKEI